MRIRGGRLLAQEVVDPLERLAVRPLRVVEHQQQRRRRRADGAGDGLEQALALPALGHRGRAWAGPGCSHQELRDHASELRLPDRFELGRGAADRFAPQPVGDRSVGQGSLCRIRLGVGGGEPLGAAPADELLEHAGLADPGLAADLEQLRGPVAPRAFQASTSDRPFVAATDERLVRRAVRGAPVGAARVGRRGSFARRRSSPAPGGAGTRRASPRRARRRARGGGSSRPRGTPAARPSGRRPKAAIRISAR